MPNYTRLDYLPRLRFLCNHPQLSLKISVIKGDSTERWGPELRQARLGAFWSSPRPPVQVPLAHGAATAVGKRAWRKAWRQRFRGLEAHISLYYNIYTHIHIYTIYTIYTIYIYYIYIHYIYTIYICMYMLYTSIYTYIHKLKQPLPDQYHLEVYLTYLEHGTLMSVVKTPNTRPSSPLLRTLHNSYIIP